MNIYLLTQEDQTGYDTFDSIIVAAPTEEDAKSIHPWDDWNSRVWAFNPENVKAELIGVANKTVERGVILSSFNAG